MRVSIGLVSNFEDVQAFLNLQKGCWIRWLSPPASNSNPACGSCIVLKQDQPTGKLTEGIVKEILTSSPTHPHGIKVRLMDGQVGRVPHRKNDLK